MQITKIDDPREFLAAVRKCKGDVFLRSSRDDIFNLKSALSRYVALDLLLTKHSSELELFCEDRDDEVHFIKYYKNYPDVIDN